MTDQLLAGGVERAEYGCITTFENAAGRTWTIHQAGPPLEALRQACTRATTIDATFRIVSMSTPQTVYRDVIGRDVAGGPGKENKTAGSPELTAATKAGVRHMIHDRLIIASDGKRFERSVRHSNAQRRAKDAA